MRSQPQRHHKGYSIVEMIMATLIVISISGVSYRVLRTLMMRQSSNVAAQKSNKTTDVALERFKKDMSMVDFNWVRYGVASIYPHPGYGFSTNYYADSQIRQVEGLSDGITFLRRDPSTDKIYELDHINAKLCYPAAQTVADRDLYGVGIPLTTVAGLNRGDWVLIYQTGKYALGLINQMNANGIQIQPPPTSVQQFIPLFNGNSTNFIIRPGVVPANMDFTGNITPHAPFDDSFCFDGGAPKIQKIASPVSYFVDYRTTDGDHKTSSNSYVLDKKGNRQKMLVRVEYVDAQKQREYVAPIDQVEFSYDLLDDPAVHPGGIYRNVGHERVSDQQQLAILSNTDPVGTDMIYESSNKIVAVNMNIRTVNETKENGDYNLKRSQELKVAIDPNLQADLYNDTMEVTSRVSKKLDTLPPVNQRTGYTYNEELGKPLYVGNVPGEEEVMVPVNTFEMDSSGDMGPHSEGGIYIYKAGDGCPVNETGNCAVNGAQSKITFNLSSGKTFFPSSIVQNTMNDGTTRITIGGVGMGTVNGVPTRSPILATIDLPPGKTLAKQLETPLTSAPCSIPGCSVQEIDNTQPGLSELVDTANVSVSSASTIFVATMTKQVNDQSPSVIFQGTWNGAGGYDYTKVADVPDSNDGRVVSAIGDRLVHVGGQAYLPVCLSKKLNCKDNGGNPVECLNNSNGAVPGTFDPNNDVIGRIELINNNSRTILMGHNYKCSSITVDADDNLLISGRLSVQMIKGADIRNAMSDPQFLSQMRSKILYLDELGAINNGQPYFADYFKIDPSTYTSQNAQDIGWLGGVSMFAYPDGTFGLVNANKYKLDAGATSAEITNTTGQPKEYANIGVEKISLAGMRDRVVATIETDSTNLNASKITASYNPALNEVPDMYLPGKFYANGTTGLARTTPTPLPSASPSMSDLSWLNLYRQMVSSTGDPILNQGMPLISSSDIEFTSCRLTQPRSCD